MRVADAELAALDAAIERALASGDEGELEVLGYGEISSVVRLGDAAYKRLPLFDRRERVDAYARVFERYLARLAERGVTPIASELHVLERADGRLAVYCVQPVSDAARIGPAALAAADDAGAAALFAAVLDRVCGAVGAGLGLDAQLSNWVAGDGGLGYLDVTTPLLRDDRGVEQLDTDLFLSSLPWAMRGVVRRFMLRGILAKYYDPRGAIVDLLGNLFKERLDRHLPAFLELANERFDRPISHDEVRGYYRGDARVWAGLQVLRRIDRAWQRGVRRRPYPFLLPGKIER